MSGRFRRVVLASGHRIDAPGRAEPRFPPEREAAVRAAMAKQLDAWKIGPADLAVASAANGADLLFLELCHARGATLRVLLPLPEEEFLERSVRRPDGDWERRYRALRALGEWRFLSERVGPPLQGDVFEQNNLWYLEVARAVAPEGPWCVLLVWDEAPSGDGPGGTFDFAARSRALGADVKIVRPLGED